MKHHKAGSTLGRDRKGRVALMRSLARSLVLHEGIETTVTRAKALRPFVETLITASKKNDVAAKRQLEAKLGSSRITVKKLHETLAPRYAKRAGGYTRIVRLGPVGKRAVEMARIEFV